MILITEFIKYKNNESYDIFFEVNLSKESDIAFLFIRVCNLPGLIN